MTRVAVAGALLLLSASAAYAGAAPQHRPGSGPCAPAVEKFCGDVPIGEGRRLVCLAKHKVQLTPACRERLAILQKMFEYGQQQKAKTEAYLAKHDPEALKEFQESNAHPPVSPPPSRAAPHK